MVSRAAWATALALLGPVLYQTFGLLPPVPVEPPGLAVGPDWTPVSAAAAGPSGVAPGSPAGTDARGLAPVYPAPDSEEAGAWRRGDTVVTTLRLVYREQEQGRELIHSANRIAPDSVLLAERSFGPIDRSGRRIREAWLRSPDGDFLRWYWYRIGGRETTSSTTGKMLEFLAFVTRRRQAELIAVTAPCAGDDCEPAARALYNFLTGGELD